MAPGIVSLAATAAGATLSAAIDDGGAPSANICAGILLCDTVLVCQGNRGEQGMAFYCQVQNGLEMSHTECPFFDFLNVPLEFLGST